jgi:hypothetical protein
MLKPLLLGSFIIIINMGIQCFCIVAMIRYLMKKRKMRVAKATFFSDFNLISNILIVLFAGHILQFVIWAQVFILIEEFTDFNTAFYHSIVNFSSLGYGDIVMSETWRLLGALEACNGVLMFSLSAGTMLALMTHIFRRHVEID